MAGPGSERMTVSQPVGLPAMGYVAMMVLILSSTPLAAKYVVRELPVGLIPLVRFGVAGLILGPLVLRGSGLGRMIREDWPRLLMASAFCVPINQWFFLTGAKYAPSGHIGLIYAACPLVVLTLAALSGQERLASGRIVGLVSSIFGVALIATENLVKAGVAGKDALRGDLLEVVAVVAWGAYLTVNKPLVARHGALPVLAATFLFGSVLDLPVVLATYSSWPPLTEVSPAAWGRLAYMATVISIGGLAFQNLAMRSLDASQVATLGNVSPVLTVVWGYLFLNERITWIAVVGGALVLGGIVWANRPARQAALKEEPEPVRIGQARGDTPAVVATR